MFEKCSEDLDINDFTKESFVLKDNVLHRLSRPLFVTKGDYLDQIVVPYRLQQKVLDLAHKDVMSGHLGVHKTFQKIRESFYWPSMRKDVKTYVNSCHECQMTGKPNKPIPKAPLQNIPSVGESFENVVIDIVGHYQEARRVIIIFYRSWIECPATQKLFL